ncbi:MAG: hypothetical protein IPN89_00640 [Saprospiraceae bacterium]|nr:hypothetical protein [Saprospiraceae bacterium]
MRSVKLILLFSLLIIGCQGNRRTLFVTKMDKNENKGFTMDADCKIQTTPGTGSDKGHITCKDVTLEYDYSLSSFRGPMTEMEEFTDAFKGYHHTKFFEIIHIDSKLHGFFRDSVKITDIKKIKQGAVNNSIITCNTCNMEALLHFRKKKYKWPYYSTLKEVSTYKIEMDTMDGYFRKLFLSGVDTLPSGVLIAPLSGKHTKPSFSVTTYSKNLPKVRKILQSISIKN